MENIIKDILNINKKLVHIRILHSNEKKKHNIN